MHRWMQGPLGEWNSPISAVDTLIENLITSDTSRIPTATCFSANERQFDRHRLGSRRPFTDSVQCVLGVKGNVERS